MGGYGNNNNNGILLNWEMGKRLEEEKINLPIAEDLDVSKYKPMPFYLFGDEIYSLKPSLMRPFPRKNLMEEEQVYNYTITDKQEVSILLKILPEF